MDVIFFGQTAKEQARAGPCRAARLMPCSFRTAQRTAKPRSGRLLRRRLADLLVAPSCQRAAPRLASATDVRRWRAGEAVLSFRPWGYPPWQSIRPAAPASHSAPGELRSSTQMVRRTNKVLRQRRWLGGRLQQRQSNFDYLKPLHHRGHGQPAATPRSSEDGALGCEVLIG